MVEGNAMGRTILMGLAIGRWAGRLSLDQRASRQQ